MAANISSTSTGPVDPVWFTVERRNFLETHGYLVVPDVADGAFCERIKENLLEFMQAWDPKLTTDHPENWTADSMPAGTLKGINRLASQLQAQWDVRQHPNVVACFAEYWQEEPGNMVSSMDAFNFVLAAASKRASGNWGHTDHGLPKAGMAQPLDGRCLQGFLNLVDCTGDNDGGLIVWDKGHRAWQGFWSHHEELQTTDNWFVYPPAYLQEIEQDGRKYLQPEDAEAASTEPVPMQRIRVRVPAGSMVFWYSKTPHQNEAPFRRDKNQAIGHDRAVVYVCQCPRSFMTQKDQKNREKAFKEHRQTSHWPAGGHVKLFPQSFRAFSKERYQIQAKKLKELKSLKIWTDKPILTELGKKLLGFPQ